MTLFEINLLVGLAVSSAIAVGLLRSLRDSVRNIANDTARYANVSVAINNRHEKGEIARDSCVVSLICVCRDKSGQRVLIADTRRVNAHHPVSLVARTQIPVTVERVIVAAPPSAELYVGKLMKGQQSLNQGTVPLVQDVLDLLTPFNLYTGDESYVCEVTYKPHYW